jgi:hypothetical protein
MSQHRFRKRRPTRIRVPPAAGRIAPLRRTTPGRLPLRLAVVPVGVFVCFVEWTRRADLTLVQRGSKLPWPITNGVDDTQNFDSISVRLIEDEPPFVSQIQPVLWRMWMSLPWPGLFT